MWYLQMCVCNALDLCSRSYMCSLLLLFLSKVNVLNKICCDLNWMFVRGYEVAKVLRIISTWICVCVRFSIVNACVCTDRARLFKFVHICLPDFSSSSISIPFSASFLSLLLSFFCRSHPIHRHVCYWNRHIFPVDIHLTAVIFFMYLISFHLLHFFLP